MIFLVRHGEAAAGWGDAPDPGLSETGRAQSQAAADELIRLGASRAITSPMKRCQETCAAFARKTGLAPEIDPRISEIETPEALEDRSTWLRGVMAGNWEDAGHDFSLWRRNALQAVADAPDNTVIFTHFVAINAIVGLLESDPRVVVFRPTYCSITRIDRRDGALSLAERGAELQTKVL